MCNLSLVLIREKNVTVNGHENSTLGKLYANGVFLCYTCEDQDRNLEDGGIKVKSKTAIPRGTYSAKTSMSNRFKKILPEILDVPQFLGIRIHGGNTAEDSEGCILVGTNRTSTGVSNCSPMVNKIIKMIDASDCATIEIK